jgi:hypothetical protein
MTGAFTARQLADILVPHLEALANVHYLLDTNLKEPARLRELRKLEDEIFDEVLQKVLGARG